VKLLSKYEFLKAVSNSLIQTISGIFSQNTLEVHSLLKKFVAFTCTLSSTHILIDIFFDNFSNTFQIFYMTLNITSPIL